MKHLTSTEGCPALAVLRGVILLEDNRGRLRPTPPRCDGRLVCRFCHNTIIRK